MFKFPEDYFDSRARFRQAASALGAVQHRFPLVTHNGAELSVDVALMGSPERCAIVLSSGLHGVEGKVGAAIQLAWMESRLSATKKGRFVLIHALNPYGYATGRRANEDNIDLNRNFLKPGSFSSLPVSPPRHAPTDYARFDALLNPACPPQRFDAFYLKSLGYLLREGKQRLQGAIVTGQYEFPKGLFYGGDRHSVTVQLVQDRIHEWIGDATQVCHLDFHSGLGRFAGCQLLVDSVPGTPTHQWYEQTFGASDVVSTYPADTQAYKAQGAMGSWLSACLHDREYRFITAEFGSYPSLSVLAALREENQAFHFTASDSVARARARQRLERVFCPVSASWRTRVIKRGLELVDQATVASGFS
ncbi:MAG: M14 family metallopeptidase [Granulosicoccus sp.]